MIRYDVETSGYLRQRMSAACSKVSTMGNGATVDTSPRGRLEGINYTPQWCRKYVIPTGARGRKTGNGSRKAMTTYYATKVRRESGTIACTFTITFVVPFNPSTV